MKEGRVIKRIIVALALALASVVAFAPPASATVYGCDGRPCTQTKCHPTSHRCATVAVQMGVYGTPGSTTEQIRTEASASCANAAGTRYSCPSVTVATGNPEQWTVRLHRNGEIARQSLMQCASWMPTQCPVSQFNMYTGFFAWPNSVPFFAVVRVHVVTFDTSFDFFVTTPSVVIP